ncbi:MAG: outer membrane protein/protective antigen [Bryobacterales bacterium]|nr:outer membrane protein/protective antigen [Bryobacterales bacterium]
MPRVFLLLFLSLSAGYGQTRDELHIACFERANLHNGKHWLEECVEQIFTHRPVHLTLSTIAPGTGVGFGLKVETVKRGGEFEMLPSLQAAVSNDKSYVLDAGLTFAAPSIFCKCALPDPPFSGRRYGQEAISLRRDGLRSDSKFSVTLRARLLDAKEQDFYGIGPDTSLSGVSNYRFRQFQFGASSTLPLSDRSSIGFAIDYLQPRIHPGANTSEPSIESLYGAPGAPGLGSRHNFIRYEPRLRFRIPAHGTNYSDLQAGYSFYQDLNGSRYSFQRLWAAIRTEYNIRIPTRATPAKRGGLANFLCPSSRSAAYCSAGDLSFNALVGIAYTGHGSQVPFYFDETLGGADLRGNDTLRGFVDYRFRGPSRVLFQAEYRHPVWGPVGVLSFYDLGKVAVVPSGLALHSLRHDIGLGVYVAATGRVVFRAYVGFGTGEPTHVNYKFPTAF